MYWLADPEGASFYGPHPTDPVSCPACALRASQSTGGYWLSDPEGASYYEPHPSDPQPPFGFCCHVCGWYAPTDRDLRWEEFAHDFKPSWSSSDMSDDSKKRKKTELSSGETLPEKNARFLDFRSAAHPMFVDKTGCIKSLPDKFEYLILRPPRFGKSTLLSTLHAYYDVQQGPNFSNLFGLLHAGEPSAWHHSQHLCLAIELFPSLHPTLATVDLAVSSAIQNSCITFFNKYALELSLQYGDPPLDDDEDDFLCTVFVQSRLFVTVDNFDSALRPCRSRLLGPQTQEPNAKTQEILNVLESRLWRPLRSAAHLIPKLIVSGTLFPSGMQLPPMAPPFLLNSCGFTESEARELALKASDQPLDFDELRRFCFCGCYLINGQMNGDDVTLHPQLVLDWIAGQENHEASFEVLNEILWTLPKSSEESRRASLDGLVEMLAVGSVLIESEVAFEKDHRQVTWAALYQAGGLTQHDGGRYRIANLYVLSLIHARIDDDIAKRYKIDWEFASIWFKYCCYRVSHPVTLLLSNVLQDVMRRTGFSGAEPNLHGVFELILHNKHAHLKTDSRPFIFAPEAHSTRVHIPQKYDDAVPAELVTLSLLGMWRGSQANEGNSMPTKEELEAFFEQLVALDEEELLSRPYCKLDEPEVVLVESFFDAELAMPQFVAVGGARVLVRPQASAEELARWNLPEESDEYC
ncbi:hypothetical protein C8F01DRAFT_1336927 [Mycena amicta]|nr:hypothetical protein C8F01DRAFT_1336927 [Mycena amicta]